MSLIYVHFTLQNKSVNLKSQIIKFYQKKKKKNPPKKRFHLWSRSEEAEDHDATQRGMNVNIYIYTCFAIIYLQDSHCIRVYIYRRKRQRRRHFGNTWSQVGFLMLSPKVSFLSLPQYFHMIF
jgi:hypothetical protein